MAADNTLTFAGNLTDDPELRFTTNGAPVANFRLAINSRVPDGQGGFRDGEATFVRVNCWRQTAENVAESLRKGDRALVTGRLRLRNWETPEGDKRSVLEVEAEDVAVSLRWATAKAERARRSNGGTPSAEAGQFTDEPPF